MITPTLAANKISKAQKLVTSWSPWWHVYLTQCDFTYVYDDTLSITGSSSLIMTVGLEFVQSHTIMDIAIALEFALQQSLRNMDSRAQRYVEDNPNIRKDIIGLAQSLEINDDISTKFSSVATDKQWQSIVGKIIDKSYLSSYGASHRPQLPEGWLIPEDFGFDPGLRAEKYIQLIIDKNQQEEEDFINQDLRDESEEDSTEDSSSNSLDNEEKGQQEQQQQSSDSSSSDSGDVRSSSISNDTEGGTPPTSSSDQGLRGRGSSSGKTGSSSFDDSTIDSETSKSNPATSIQDFSKNGLESHTGHENNPSESNKKENGQDSSFSQPASPFRDSYSQDIQDANPAPQTDSPSVPPKVNACPKKIEEPSSIEGANSSSTVDIPEDTTSIEQSISQDFDKEHNQIPQRASQPDSHFGSPDGDAEREVENPWDNSDKSPSGNTAPQPGEGNPIESDQDKLAAMEAGLADELDDTSQGTQKGYDNLKKQYEHLIDRAKNNSGQSGLHNFDIPQHRTDTSAVGLSSEEKRNLDKKLAESIQEHQDTLPKNGGYSAGDSFVEWSCKKLRKPVVPWQKVLRSMVTNTVSRAQMSGQSDLSYSKPNPNQQPDMPIMMGLITYPPEVTVLVDASPSMLRRKEKVISEFAGVIQRILIQYSQPVVMAAADNSIKYVAYSISPAKSIIKNIGKTFDGSSAQFGETLKRTARKGAKFRGRNFPAPDVMIVMTDCLFQWPLPENASLPLNYATVIVASTEPYEDVEKYLPRWVKKNKNFVHIND